MAKFIFVTGGVLSALGKGIAAASIGNLLESHGYKISMVKFDPYLNVDPGTMNPFQHGEVYVTDDGAETDLDLGHYERFTTTTTGKPNNWTAGKIYETIIKKERRGEFLGKTVQVIPHVTDEIKRALDTAAVGADIVIVEIGGTVGDIESLPFLEATRQMRLTLGSENALFVHLTLVPYIKTSGELKTKPTQHSVKELRTIGIQPDILLCRTDRFLTQDIKSKIALFTNVPLEAVITAKDVDNIYEIPLIFAKEGLDGILLKLLNLSSKKRNMERWRTLVRKMSEPTGEVDIAVVGKYAGFQDSYLSLKEALKHGGVAHRVGVNIHWIEAEEFEQGRPPKALRGMDGILIPGGFGHRGIEGKVKVVALARERKIPFFGICLGMQCAVIEFSRNIAGLKGAHSTEFDPDALHKVFFLWRELKRDHDLGGTMRLGRYACDLEKNTVAHKAYRNNRIWERHRHRYEFNPEYEARLALAGMVFSGRNIEHKLIEIVELKDHPWFLGCQFHPEFKSRPLTPHPLFKAFIGASHAYRLEKHKS